MSKVINQKVTKRVLKPKIDESLLTVNPFGNGLISKIHEQEKELIVEDESITKVYTRASLRLHIMALPDKAKSILLKRQESAFKNLSDEELLKLVNS